MTTDYCNDCGEHVDSCTCPAGEDEMENIAPTDKLFKQGYSKKNKDSWDDFYVREEDGIEFERAAYDADMERDLTGKGHLSTMFGYVDDEAYDTAAVSCRHCDVVVTDMRESHFECPCCHRLTRAMPSKVK